MLAARASAEWASMSTSRVWISAMRWASRAVSASAIRALRSRSAASTMSTSGSAVAGASCATCPMRQLRGSETDPDSGASSPETIRKSVDLPAPLRPTSPALVPAGSVSEALSIRSRPAMRAERFEMVSMGRLLTHEIA